MKLFHIIGIAAVAAASFNTEAIAQRSPSEAFGVGINVGAYSGIQAQYALSPAIHIGTQFGLGINSIKTNGNSVSRNEIFFGPYAKFLFNGPATFKPYITAQFAISSVDGESSNNLNAFAGAEYFVSDKLGIFGQVRVIGLGFGDNSFTSIGVGVPMVGIEWFF